LAHEEGQQHPIKLYLVIWGWLFVLSTCSYLVDFFGIHGYLRWSLILLFMIVKAGLIVAIFMHMAWERLALMYAILRPLSPKCQESRQPRSARRGSRARLDLAATDPGLGGRRPVRLPVCGACRELPAGESQLHRDG
jgi:cytochrome c oxidase subunit IV